MLNVPIVAAWSTALMGTPRRSQSQSSARSSWWFTNPCITRTWIESRQPSPYLLMPPGEVQPSHHAPVSPTRRSVVLPGQPAGAHQRLEPGRRAVAAQQRAVGEDVLPVGPDPAAGAGALLQQVVVDPVGAVLDGGEEVAQRGRGVRHRVDAVLERLPELRHRHLVLGAYGVHQAGGELVAAQQAALERLDLLGCRARARDRPAAAAGRRRPPTTPGPGASGAGSSCPSG